MQYIALIIASFVLGVVVCRNTYYKDSIFSDVDIMLITQQIETHKGEEIYEKLKFEWEYVLRIHEQNIDHVTPELQKIIDHVLALD
jgi:hypothetical protein